MKKWVRVRNATNGTALPAGPGLLGALTYYGLDHISAAEKDMGRDMVMRGGHWHAAERQYILDYCQSDVDALDRLLGRMQAGIDLPRALLRGRYMAAVARIEWRGAKFGEEIDDVGRHRPVEDEVAPQFRGSGEANKQRLFIGAPTAPHRVRHIRGAHPTFRAGVAGQPHYPPANLSRSARPIRSKSRFRHGSQMRRPRAANKSTPTKWLRVYGLAIAPPSR
jgi:hypothetical protein